MIALSAALSLVKIWQMPLGGEVTLFSMVPIILVAWISGAKWGIPAGFIFALIRIAIDLPLLLGYGVSWGVLFGSFFLDYIIPFSVLGLVGLFSRKSEIWLYIGTFTVLLIRFVAHIASGVILFASFSPWGNVWLYAVSYNGTFLLPELILTMIGLILLMKTGAVKKMSGTING